MDTLYPLAVDPRPLPQPLEATDPLPVSMDLPVLDISLNGILQCVVFCVWLLSPSTISPSSMHGMAGVHGSLLSMAESYFTVWMDHVLSLHPSANVPDRSQRPQTDSLAVGASTHYSCFCFAENSSLGYCWVGGGCLGAGGHGSLLQPRIPLKGTSPATFMLASPALLTLLSSSFF